MPQYFIKASDIDGDKCIISGDDYRHLRRVRRAGPGDYIDLRLEDGCLYKGRILEIRPVHLTVEILERNADENPPIKLTLYASILKGKMFDFVLQKAAELGISRIVPVITERTVPVIDNNMDKRKRWERILVSASKQCMRRDIPVLDDVTGFGDAVSCDSRGTRIIAHPRKGKNIREYLAGINKREDVSLLIGPEGGFTEKELESAEKHGWDHVVFGFTSLRSETASVVLPAILIYEWGATSQK